MPRASIGTAWCSRSAMTDAEWAAREDDSRNRRDRRRALVAAAFNVWSQAFFVDPCGVRELVILSPSLDAARPGWRLTFLAADGPRGHLARGSVLECTNAYADGYLPGATEHATDAAVAVWTSTPEFLEGCARIESVRLANERRR